MGQGFNAHLVASPGQQMSQLGVAFGLESHIADEVRQLVAGVDTLEVRGAIDVVIGIDQPVGVKDHQRVDTGLTTAAR